LKEIPKILLQIPEVDKSICDKLERSMNKIKSIDIICIFERKRLVGKLESKLKNYSVLLKIIIKETLKMLYKTNQKRILIRKHTDQYLLH
jgi:hypothetical protein